MLRALKLNSNLYFHNNSGINMKQVIHPFIFHNRACFAFPQILVFVCENVSDVYVVFP